MLGAKTSEEETESADGSDTKIECPSQLSYGEVRIVK